MEHMKRPVATIEEPNGDIRYVALPYFLHENANIEDAIEMINFVYNLALIVAGNGTVIDIEWMGEEEL